MNRIVDALIALAAISLLGYLLRSMVVEYHPIGWLLLIWIAWLAATATIEALA